MAVLASVSLSSEDRLKSIFVEKRLSDSKEEATRSSRSFQKPLVFPAMQQYNASDLVRLPALLALASQIVHD